MFSINLRAVPAAVALLAALVVPASAMADTSSEQGIVSALKRPAVLDGKVYSAKQMKQRFAGKPLYFVLGDREEASGAVAAFRTRADRRRYLDRTERSPQRTTQARAAWNGFQAEFYENKFLEGASLAVAANSSAGNLAQYCMYGNWFGCSITWDNQISSAKTGYSGAELFDRPWHDRAARSVFLTPQDSVEVWRFFDNFTSSIFVPKVVL